MDSKKIEIPIKGMHCRSCEIMIEDSIKKVSGVEKAEARQSTASVSVFYSDQEPNKKEIEQAIMISGYTVGTQKKLPLFSNNPGDYRDFLIAFAVLLVISLFLFRFKIIPTGIGSLSDSVSAFTILLVGLTAGFSTCLALVGGLVLGISADYVKHHPASSRRQRFQSHLYFNIGRVAGYAFLGGLLGLAGSTWKLSNISDGVITTAIGIFLLVLGLKITGLIPRLNNFQFALPKKIARFTGINVRSEKYRHRRTFATGALTFFLPCGFTQAMQLYALGSGSFFFGAMVMAIFAIGTVPGLIGIGGIVSSIKGAFAKRFFKFAGVAVIFMAFFNISNGYNLLSLGSASPKKIESEKNQSAVIKNQPSVQIITMDEISSGYSPNQFKIKKNVPVRWLINAKAPNSCASSLIMPKFGIKKNLTAGENIIEFTPEETGTIPFSCSMGMYRGSFTVTE
jgi:uncharacterized protein